LHKCYEDFFCTHLSELLPRCLTLPSFFFLNQVPTRWCVAQILIHLDLKTHVSFLFLSFYRWKSPYNIMVAGLNTTRPTVAHVMVHKKYVHFLLQIVFHFLQVICKELYCRLCCMDFSWIYNIHGFNNLWFIFSCSWAQQGCRSETATK
jgi:hypothetical protein